VMERSLFNPFFQLKSSNSSEKSSQDNIVRFYIFNYTNVDEFVAGIDKKLHLEEIGPFTFAEITEKIVLRSDEISETFQVSTLMLLLSKTLIIE
jgi:hypothetical protein